MTAKAFSQACENNKTPILAVLQAYLGDSRQVLEIGSGTGQHAVYFAPRLPHLLWQTSDLAVNHASITAWIDDNPSDNLKAPIEFQIGLHPWPMPQADAVFTANSTHIMQADEAKQMMQMVAEHLPLDGVFCQYGPFNIDGRYTSESNQAFDQHLLAQGCGGIRDIAELQEWDKGLELVAQVPMPANNFTLVWKKKAKWLLSN